MPVLYPGGLDSMPNPSPTQKTNDPGFELDVVIGDLGDAIQALEAKLGVGAAEATIAPGHVLRASAAGISGWGPISGDQIADGSLTAVDLAANAITHYYRATATGMNVGSAYPVDAGLSISVTTQATDTGVLICLSGTYANSTAGAICTIGYHVVTGDVVGRAYWAMNANQHASFCMLDVIANPGATTQTHKMRFGANAGVITAHATITAIVFHR